MTQKGGRGKKAPYNTTHVRIPENIKSTVDLISNYYKEQVEETGNLEFDKDCILVDRKELLKLFQKLANTPTREGKNIKVAVAEIADLLGFEFGKINQRWTVKDKNLNN